MSTGAERDSSQTRKDSQCVRAAMVAVGGTEDALRLNMLRSVVGPIALLAAAALASCVWTNGNPEPVAPSNETLVLAAPPAPSDIMWSARIAPTSKQAADLAVLRAAAQSHRTASPAVRVAERAACAGMGDDDRDVTPFFYRDDIMDVQPLRAADGTLPGRLEGAVVTFRRLEGLSAERLQRLVYCQIARNAALEYRVPEVEWCPLAVRGALARVSDTEHGLDVRIVAADASAARETYVRAIALASLR